MKNTYDYHTIKAHSQDRSHCGAYQVSPRERNLWRIVDTFAKCLQREMHYDFPMFDVDGAVGDGVVAYLFGDGAVWYGGCGLRDTAHAPIMTAVPYVMEWIWVHPFARGQGLLIKAWPRLEAGHGEFLLQAPPITGNESVCQKARCGKRPHRNVWPPS